LISSPGPGEGKTTVSSYLAATIAKSGRRVVLVDADLRRPGIHKFFGVSNKIGLSDMLKDDLVPQVAAQSVGNHRFKVIPSGRGVDNPAELFGSVWLLKVLTHLRELSDVAVFDGPPFMAAEAYILAARLEGVLVVIQPGQTREVAATAIMQQLERAQANLLGVVLNRVPRSQLYGAGRYPYYDYDWQQQQDGDSKRGRPKPTGGTQATGRGQVVMRKAPRKD
jgi:capsular exopolysaccharide synthesis family protein